MISGTWRCYSHPLLEAVRILHDSSEWDIRRKRKAVARHKYHEQYRIREIERQGRGRHDERYSKCIINVLQVGRTLPRSRCLPLVRQTSHGIDVSCDDPSYSFVDCVFGALLMPFSTIDLSSGYQRILNKFNRKSQKAFKRIWIACVKGEGRGEILERKGQREGGKQRLEEMMVYAFGSVFLTSLYRYHT